MYQHMLEHPLYSGWQGADAGPDVGTGSVKDVGLLIIWLTLVLLSFQAPTTIQSPLITYHLLHASCNEIEGVVSLQVPLTF
jgi:hypothetical protein